MPHSTVATSNQTQDMKASERKIRYGMIGGGRGAFIGAVHRIAAGIDGSDKYFTDPDSPQGQQALANMQQQGQQLIQPQT